MSRRGAGIVIVVIVVMALVGLGMWRRHALLDERDAARQARARSVTALVVARRALELSVRRAGEVETANLGVRREAEELTAIANGVALEVTAVARERDDAALQTFVASGQLGTLRTCLDGINRALNQVSVGDPGAVGTLDSVRTSCRAVG